jgi:hypothetical protein
MDQLRCRKAVVEFDEVEILGSDAGLFVGSLGGVSGERVDVRQDLAGLFVGVGREHRRRHFHGASLLAE